VFLLSEALLAVGFLSSQLGASQQQVFPEKPLAIRNRSTQDGEDQSGQKIEAGGQNQRGDIVLELFENSQMILSGKTPEQLFNHAVNTIQHLYVDPLDRAELYRNALRGILNSLDPYCSYFTAQDFEKLSLDMAGKFVGIGVILEKNSVLPQIVSFTKDSPASRAGMKVGDYIGKINGVSTYGMGTDEIVRLISGKPGTKINILVLRENSDEPLEFNLKREILKNRTVWGRIEKNGIVYVRIDSFTSSTGKELAHSLRKLIGRGDTETKGVIIDLRDNPGGTLDGALEVAEMFLEKNRVITIIKDRNDIVLRTYRSTKNGLFHRVPPLFLLVNGETASAPELVAGALQDHGRARVLGIKTYGKASVQSIIPLSDGGAIKLSVARYYTPLGRSVQHGIEPDTLIEENAPIGSTSTTTSTDAGGSKEINGGIAGYGSKNMDYQLQRALDLIITCI
jgi:carboxyl-terminal processing protease